MGKILCFDMHGTLREHWNAGTHYGNTNHNHSRAMSTTSTRPQHNHTFWHYTLHRLHHLTYTITLAHMGMGMGTYTTTATVQISNYPTIQPRLAPRLLHILVLTAWSVPLYTYPRFSLSRPWSFWYMVTPCHVSHLSPCCPSQRPTSEHNIKNI